MTETKTIRKIFYVWEFEKEEDWLNEMALNGWALKSVGLCKYVFERCEPGEYIVRIQMHGPDDAYVDFMKETGAEYVGRMAAWVYFRKKAEEGPFELFSDIDSRIAHLKKINLMLMIVCAFNLFWGLYNSFMAARTGVSIGWINLLCAMLLSYCIGRIHGKEEALKRERRLHE